MIDWVSIIRGGPRRRFSTRRPVYFFAPRKRSSGQRRSSGFERDQQRRKGLNGKDVGVLWTGISNSALSSWKILRNIYHSTIPLEPPHISLPNRLQLSISLPIRWLGLGWLVEIRERDMRWFKWYSRAKYCEEVWNVMLFWFVDFGV